MIYPMRCAASSYYCYMINSSCSSFVVVFSRGGAREAAAAAAAEGTKRRGGLCIRPFIITIPCYYSQFPPENMLPNRQGAALARASPAPNRQPTRVATPTTTAAGPRPSFLLLRPPSLLSPARHRRAPVLRATGDKQSTGKGGGAGESSGLGFKAAWVAAEVLGNVVGGAGGAGGASAAPPAAAAAAAGANNNSRLTRLQILASIKEDFEANYFLTGQGEMRAYDPDCLYADPFSSFRGTRRFKKNVANFGAVVDAVKVDLGEIGPDPRDPSNDNVVYATWRFSGIVKVLPWRPVLAASGSTRHVIDPSRGLVIEHVEEWASSPGEVLERLWEPSNRGPPVNRWEAALGALSRSKKESGGGGGDWGAALRAALEFKAPPPPPAA